MKRLTYIFALVCLLCATCCPLWATDVNHSFHEDLMEGKLSLSPTNKIGTMSDGVTYKCAKNATYAEVSAKICINLPNKYDSVTIAPPFPKLVEMVIWRLPATKFDDKIKVSVSSDGTTWTRIPDDKMDYTNADYVIATIPSSVYYLKIFNSTSTAVAIRKIRYTMLDCNCFSYTP